LETLGGTGSFYRSGIVTLYLPKLKSSTGLMMFQESESLETVNLPEITTINSNQMFHKCPLLKNVYVPKLTTLTTLVFSSCTSLEVIDLPCVTKIGGKCFVGTTNLKAVILRSSTLATAGETIFKNSKIMEGTGFVYVPSALVDDYKTATNWTEYANQIRALEDYTVDGTTTGELDESKI